VDVWTVASSSVVGGKESGDGAGGRLTCATGSRWKTRLSALERLRTRILRGVSRTRKGAGTGRAGSTSGCGGGDWRCSLSVASWNSQGSTEWHRLADGEDAARKNTWVALKNLRSSDVPSPETVQKESME
jgi:hypothetical protein